MAIATIYQIPKTPEELSLWSFSHMAHHRDINRVIFQTRSQRLDEYVLDPVDPLNMGNWPALHQIMHQQFCAALGIAGYDISVIDWKDDAALSDWFTHNADEHYRAGAILGLG